MGQLGDTASGAAGGALAGGALGGPLGAGIGAVAGGAYGYFTSNDEEEAQKQRLQMFLQQYQNRNAPQMGAAAQSATSGFRTNQSDLVTRLEAMSRGQGPSLAREQLREATGRNMGQQAAIAQTGRGNAALAGIQASNASGQLGSQAAMQAVQGRLAEQTMATGMLGSVIGQGRQGDEGNTQFNAQQQNVHAQANLEAKLRTMGMNDQQIRAILEQMGAGANQPSGGEQLMAGGAGMYGAKLGASGGGAARTAPPQRWPGDSGYTPQYGSV